jgi:hypothetical protein
MLGTRSLPPAVDPGAVAVSMEQLDRFRDRRRLGDLELGEPAPAITTCPFDGRRKENLRAARAPCSEGGALGIVGNLAETCSEGSGTGSTSEPMLSVQSAGVFEGSS